VNALPRLVAGLDALDDFVRLRLRQAVAELRERQDQIDATLARPDASPERPIVAPPRAPDGDPIGPLNEEESERSYPVVDAEQGRRYRADADEEDEGPPQTWLV